MRRLLSAIAPLIFMVFTACGGGDSPPEKAIPASLNQPPAPEEDCFAHQPRPAQPTLGHPNPNNPFASILLPPGVQGPQSPTTAGTPGASPVAGGPLNDPCAITDLIAASLALDKYCNQVVNQALDATVAAFIISQVTSAPGGMTGATQIPSPPAMPINIPPPCKNHINSNIIAQAMLLYKRPGQLWFNADGKEVIAKIIARYVMQAFQQKWGPGFNQNGLNPIQLASFAQSYPPLNQFGNTALNQLNIPGGLSLNQLTALLGPLMGPSLAGFPF